MNGRTAYVADYLRSPFGRYGGVLSGVRTDDLAAVPIAALLARNPVLPEAIDDVILGATNQAGEDNRNVGRMAALLAGLPESVPGTTINRLCGSGLDAVASAARMIAVGEADLVIAGGVESMSRAPYVIPKSERPFAPTAEIASTTLGWRLVNPRMEALGHTDSLGMTAENVASEFGISRQQQDEFAVMSQERTAAAMQNGRLAMEIIPVGDADLDEHPRPGTTIEKLATLKPAFKEGGTVTAGNSSGINDGAAALLIASETAMERFGLSPLCRVVGSAVVGVPPRIMGIGPVPATRKLLDRHQLEIGDIDVMEINEAFASQSVYSVRELGLDPELVNPNGGAIALGHPTGASGARIAGSAAIELRERGANRAVATMCVGVGQGIAVLLEA